jgi:hypothetical protein
MIDVSTEQVTKDIPDRPPSHAHAQHKLAIPSPLGVSKRQQD